MGKRALALAFLVVLSVQAADAGESTSDEFSSAWAQQQRCWNAWDHLVAGWKRNGGGFGQSIVATRRQISEDRISKFAAIVRAAWAMRKTSAARDQLGHWPVSDSDYREVGRAVANAARRYIHEEACRGAYWLDAVLWDELRGVDGDPAKARSIEEMPNTIDSQDAHNAADWTTYWLFARTEM